MRFISQMIAVSCVGAAMVVQADTWKDSAGYTWSYSIVFGGTARISGVSPSTGGITIPRYIPSPSGYGNYIVSVVDVFNHCAGLTGVRIPDANHTLSVGGFNYCEDLTIVLIGKGVWKFGGISYCSRLKSFSVADDNDTYKPVSGLLLTKDGKSLVSGVNGNVTIPDGVTDINVGAFCGCSGLASVEMPDGMLTIGKRAFYDCTRLANLVLPNSVTDVDDDAFGNCIGLTNVAINGDMNIADHAFDGCGSLRGIVIGNDVTSINRKLFGGCEGLQSFSVDTGNAVYKDENGLLLTKDGTTLVMVPKGLRDVVIPDGVTKIADGAFYGCNRVASVTIPGSVTSITGYTLSGCSGLKSVKLANGIRRIEKHAFYGTRTLSGTMVIPTSVEAIDENAFANHDILEFRFLGPCPSGLRWFQLKESAYERIPGDGYYAFSPKGAVSVYP